MTDAGNPILIDIQSAQISAYEDSNANVRYNLGYISGEFSSVITSSDLYVRVWFKRGLEMQWENIQFKLNNGRKIFRQKLPPGLTVTTFYVQLYGWISPQGGNADFALTDFELSIKLIPIGKFAGEPLGIDTSEEPPPPPIIEPFVMYLDTVGEVQATQAKAVWFTTHEATTKITYGFAPNQMFNVIEDLTFTQFHSIIIPNLEVGKLYYIRFYSTSKITGQIIQSDIKSFTTAPELIITNYLDNLSKQFDIDDKINLDIINIIGEQDFLTTIIPDSVDALNNDMQYSIINKTNLSMINIIGNEFSTSLN